MANLAKAKSWFKSFRIAYTKTGAPAMLAWREAGEAIYEGDPLTIALNKVSEGAANSGALYGIALADTDIGDDVPIAVADESTVYMGQADDDTGTLTDLPQLVDIVEGSDGWKIDVGGNTEKVIRVLDYVPGDDTSDTLTPGRFYFQIHRSQWNELVAALT